MLFRLKCPVQNYAWGKLGTSSSVAQLASAAGEIQVDEAAPYAELWMGTHPNGPAMIEVSGNVLPLRDWLAARPEYLSVDKSLKTGDLPYLFKVLSVGSALSIQAHPDIPLAQKLHAERPKIYKDPNHKPEMACAITEFEALAGFEKIETVLDNIERVPELQALLAASPVAQDAISTFKGSEAPTEEIQKLTLKEVFTALMKSDPELVNEQANALGKRLKRRSSKSSRSSSTSLTAMDSLALRLTKEYPGDVGVFCAYILCYRTLKPGDAVFLGANEPHAYLKGDCTEIMACSDNVVRAGLTPKLRDVDTLCEMLTYRQPGHSGGEFHPGNLLGGLERNEYTVVYSPPDPAVVEFEMERTLLPASTEYALPLSAVGCLILVLEGSGTASVEGEPSLAPVPLERGSVLYQTAGSKVNVASCDEGVLFFRATTKGAVSGP